MTQRPVLAAEYGYCSLRPEIRAGRLRRLRRGAYVLPNDDVGSWECRLSDLHARCYAVGRSLATTFAFSHTTAAFLLGLPAPVEPVVHIVQAVRPSRADSSDIHRHYTGTFPSDEVTLVDGLPVTSLGRTAVDCALWAPPRVALAVADGALRRLANVNRFDRVESLERQERVRAQWLEQLNQRGRVSGVVRARLLLTLADGFSESGGESWLRWMALAFGLPAPELQVPIEVKGSTLFPDALWRSGSTVVMAEYDGMGKYQAGAEGREAAAAVVAQTHREGLLASATGGTVIRFTRHDQQDPAAAFRRLAAALPPSLVRDVRPRPLLEPYGRRASR